MRNQNGTLTWQGKRLHEKPVGGRLLEKATDKPKRANTGAI